MAARTRYRVGEGITGRVVQSGRPVVVPRVSREPLFLNRTGIFAGKGELSYMCVPILLDGKPAGALGVALPFHKDRSFDPEVKFFSLAASLIAQALRVERLVESERQLLAQENQELRQELQQRYQMRNLIGSSRPMQQVYEQVAQVAAATHHRC